MRGQGGGGNVVFFDEDGSFGRIQTDIDAC